MLVRTRYQYGSLRLRKRERGPDVWEFRYYETDSQGKRKRQSVIDETGAPMKVQQELMRHASIQTTMNVYGRAMTETERRANSQVVGLVFGPNSQQLSADAATATVQQIAVCSY